MGRGICRSALRNLKKEVELIWSKGKAVIFDIDVEGGLNLKVFSNKML